MGLRCFLVVPTGNVNPRVPILDDTDVEIGAHIDFQEYKRLDTGETAYKYPWEFGPGAMWFADISYMDGSDYLWNNEDAHGRLHVVCPNGRHWDIDSRCSNCTLPNDHVHRCWVCHGEPPNITVDKQGVTCAAGAGSILAGDYHGFLRNGEFTQV